MFRTRMIFIFCSALVGAGCQSYQPQPLVPLEILDEVERARDLLDIDVASGASADGAATDRGFLRAAQWMSAFSPALKEARAAFDRAHAVAGIDTPWPNPTLSAGPAMGSRLDPGGGSRRVQPLVEFGFAIPLSGRLGYTDDLNRATAQSAHVALVAEHRRSYLELRALYADWVLARKNVSVQNEILESARRSLALTGRLIDAGSATALDLGLMELEVARREMMLLDTRSAEVKIEERLSSLIGVSFGQLQNVFHETLPALDAPIPHRGSAQTILVANHPELAALRAAYEVAERELRLEIAKQYPDLELGPFFEGDPGERKKVWGLTIGITLPLFDRNEQAIAAAEKQRDAVRVAYEAALNRQLAALESALARYGLAREKSALLETVIVPRAKNNLDVALQSIKAAAIDSLKYLDVERALRSAISDALQAESAIRHALNDIEQAIGIPLGYFPGEEAVDFPLLPEPLTETE